MLSVFALPREFKLRPGVRMRRRDAKLRFPSSCWPIVLQSLCGLMSAWRSSRENKESTICSKRGASPLRGLLCFHGFPLSCSLFFSVNLFEILQGFKPLPLPLSHPLSHTHLVSWLQQGLKRLQFISTHSGWRPHLVAAGNSISLPHTDEWVTTFRAPVNMCLLW